MDSLLNRERRKEIIDKIKNIKARVLNATQKSYRKLINKTTKKNLNNNPESTYKKRTMKTRSSTEQSSRGSVKRKVSTKQHIKAFQQSGIKHIESLSEKEIEKILKVSNEAYRNEDPIMTDNEYDIVFDYMKEKYPNNPVTKKIGAPIQGKNKVKLPYEMASMDKIKPDTKALGNWLKKYKGDYVISAKLDGMSALYINSNGVSKLFTRGCGTFGFDISHLIPYVKLPEITDMAVRGELIITKNNFIYDSNSLHEMSVHNDSAISGVMVPPMSSAFSR